MAMFQDAMDSDRVVKVLSSKGKSLECAVYWRSKNGLNFGGKVSLPASLFDESNLRNRYIGFYPVNQ